MDVLKSLTEHEKLTDHDDGNAGVFVWGTDYIVESIPSSRNRATVHLRCCI